MKTLFDKTQIKGMTLKNRFIRSATHEAMAEDEGYASERLADVFEELAKGGVGLIITGFAYTLKGENPSHKMLAAFDDSHIEGMKKLSQTAHRHGAKIIFQAASGGSQTKLNHKNRNIYGPSSIEHLYTKITPIEMTKEKIHSLVEAFGDAAVRAEKAVFDGFQIHAAHGYLLSQFLTPYYNRRTDKYGGNIENRARIIFEVYENIRKKTSEDFILSLKINCSDFMGEDGLQFEESKYICQKLDTMGIDLIEISGNVGYNEAMPMVIQPGINKNAEKQCYFSRYASEIANMIKTPVAVVGGNRNFSMMQKILKETNINYFSLSRSVLCEADLVNKWEENPYYEPKCLTCNKCWSLKGNVCIFNR